MRHLRFHLLAATGLTLGLLLLCVAPSPPSPPGLSSSITAGRTSNGEAEAAKQVVSVVVVGATGDLAAKYLWVALFRLALHAGITTGRSYRFVAGASDSLERGEAWSRAFFDETFARRVCGTRELPDQDADAYTVCRSFLEEVFKPSVRYVPLRREEHYRDLAAALHQENGRLAPGSEEVGRLVYLAIPPQFFLQHSLPSHNSTPLVATKRHIRFSREETPAAMAATTRTCGAQSFGTGAFFTAQHDHLTAAMQRQSRGIDPELFAPSASAGGDDLFAPSAAQTKPPASSWSSHDPDASRGGSGGSCGSFTGYLPRDDYGHVSGNNQLSQRYQPQQQDVGVTLELEHLSGFTGKGKGTIHAHPTDPDSYITCMGSAVVIGNVYDSQSQQLLRAHDEEINALSVSSTGSMLASAQVAPAAGHTDRGGALIVVWDLAAGRERHRLQGFQRSVLQMAFSPDDHFLAASSEDSRVVLWDMRTSEVVLSKTFPAPVGILNWGQMDEKCRRPKYSLTFAHASQLLSGELAYDLGGMQYRLEVSSFAMPNVGLARSYLCATVPPSRVDVLAGTLAGELVVFNADARVYRNAVPVSRNGVHSLAACGSTGHVYVGAGDGVLKKLVGRDSEWSLVGQVQLVGGISSLSVGPGGQQLFAGTSAGKMYRLEAATLTPTELASSHLGVVTGCAFGDASDQFATISMDGSVRVWDLDSYRLKCLATEAAAGLCLAVTRASKTQSKPQSLLVSGWADGWLRAYDAATAQPKWHIATAHRGQVTAVATSEHYVVSGASDGGVSVWSFATRELVLQFHEHKGAVSGVLVDVKLPHRVHSCGLDKALFIYDLQGAGRRIVAQQVRDGAFLGLTQRLDSETEVVTAGADGRLLFWDCDEPEPVALARDPSRLQVVCASVSPSGRFLATGGEDCTVKLLELRDTQSVTLLAVAHAHSQPVKALAWSPDERQLVSVGADACICVWNFFCHDA